jgi:PAS domain-containing protein
MSPTGRPLQLILARNLLASLDTAAFLIDARGEVVFYNEAAGTVLGRRFEESGPMPAEEWTALFGPVDADGKPLSYREIGVTKDVRGDRPAHATMTIRSAKAEQHRIAVSAFPIHGDDGFHGAMVFFWPHPEDED